MFLLLASLLGIGISILVGLFILPLHFHTQVYALNQTNNWSFPSDASSWSTQNGRSSNNCGNTTSTVATNMATFAFDGASGNSAGSIGAISGTTASTDYRGLISETFMAPGSGTVNVKGKFDYSASSTAFGAASSAYVRLDIYDSTNNTFVGNLGCVAFNTNQSWTSTSLSSSVALTGGTVYTIRGSLRALTKSSDPAAVSVWMDNVLVTVAPTGLTASAPAATTNAGLSWTVSTGGAEANGINGSTPYKVYRDTSSPVSTFLANSMTNSYTDTTTSPNTTYYFAVTDVDSSSVESPLSSETSLLTLPGAPGTPTFSNDTGTSVTVSWTAPSGGATTYKVERCTGSGCSNFAEITSGVVTTSYNNSGLSGNTTYRYRIRATNATGDGAYSGTGQETTPTTPFITRNGSGLILGGVPFKFSGANMNWLGIKPNMTYPTHFEIENAFATAKEMGANVVRTHAFFSANCGACILPSLNTFNDAAFEPVDYAVKVASDSGVRLIGILMDNYYYSRGGKMNFTDWRGITNGTQNSPEENQFFTDATVIADFKNYISHVLNHVNQYTGIAYKDDPTIMAWQTGNEMGVTGGVSWTFDSWTGDIATYIKSLAPSTLVADGRSTAGGGKSNFTSTQLNLASVDMYSKHQYKTQFGDTYLHSDFLINNCQLAAAANKVCFLGEYEWSADTTTTLNSYLAALEGEPTISGDMYWILWGHKDPNNYLTGSAYPLNYPGRNDANQTRTRAQSIRTHAYTMRGLSVPAHIVPDAPVLYALTGSSNNVTINWRGVVGADTYTIERSSNSGSSWTTVNSGLTDFDSPALDSSGQLTYAYRIRGFNMSGVPGSYATIGTILPPTLTSITISDTSGFTNDATPTITIVSSGSPANVAFSCNGGTNYSSWITYASTISSFDITNGATGCTTSDGSKTITAKLKDVMGNESTTTNDSTFYDTTAPSLSTKNTFSGWYTSNQTSTFTYTDGSGSGIASGTPVNCIISTEGSSQTCSVTPNVCDVLGNCNTTLVTSNGASVDKTAPASGSIEYTDGYFNSASVPLTVNDGTDSGSGINTATRVFQRQSASLLLGICGTYGSFSPITPDPTVAYPNFTDTTVVSGNCYKYEYQVSDTAGNQATYTSGNAARIDTSSPDPTPTPTPTPTSTPTSTNSNATSSNSNSSSTSPPSCNDSAPPKSELFRIDIKGTSAKLFFTPLQATNKYYVSFSTKSNAEEHGVEVTLANEGVQSYTVNALKPYSNYYFKIRGQNGCMPGVWSNIVIVKSKSISMKTTISYYMNSLKPKAVAVLSVAKLPRKRASVSTLISPLTVEVIPPKPMVETVQVVQVQPEVVTQSKKKNFCVLWWCW